MTQLSLCIENRLGEDLKKWTRLLRSSPPHFSPHTLSHKIPSGVHLDIVSSFKMSTSSHPISLYAMRWQGWGHGNAFQWNNHWNPFPRPKPATMHWKTYKLKEIQGNTHDIHIEGVQQHRGGCGGLLAAVPASGGGSTVLGRVVVVPLLPLLTKRRWKKKIKG